MADIESALVSEIAANNTAPSPDGLPPNSSPNIVYTQGREALAMAKRAWNRLAPTQTSTGAANVQLLTYTSAPASYIQGQGYCFIAGFTNTGAMTLNVNGLGAKNVFQDGVALGGGEIRAGLIIEVFYDGVNFQITSGRALASLSSTLGSMRNFLINPLFNVQQRGAQNAYNLSFAASTNPYTVDRWYLHIGASNATSMGAVQLFGSAAGPFVLQINRNPGQTGTTAYWLGQAFDTDIIQLLAGQQVTASVQVQAQATYSGGAVFLQLVAGTGAPTRVVSGFTGSNNVISVSGTPTPGGGAITISGTGTIPANTRQLEFLLTWTPTGTAGATDTLQIQIPRLNLGPVDLGPDLTRIYTTELPICQRFFQKSFVSTVAPAQNATANNAWFLASPVGASGGISGLTIPFITRMRGAPQIVGFNPQAANSQVRNTTLGTDCTATAGTAQTNESGIVLTTTTPASTVAGNALAWHWTADAEIM